MTRLRREDGFTMPLILGVLVVTLLLGLAAFQSARGDIGTSASSRDRKQAYAAAESGLSWYAAQLGKDNAFWSKCDSVGSPVSKEWKEPATPGGASPADTRRWKTLSGTTARYTIELLAAGSTSTDDKQCDTTKTGSNMLDADGVFRIKSTGQFNGYSRSIVAAFRRTRFLDFLYFTDYETTDPIAYSSNATVQKYANDYCADKYRTDRDASPYGCLEIQFANGDEINGPLHSNDSLLICGNPKFGRSGGDKITTMQNEADTVPGYANPGWRRACTGATPNFVGAYRYAQPKVTLPVTNTALKADTTAAYQFTGTTRLVLNGSTNKITAYNRSFPGPSYAKTLDWPANGLIYVDGRTSAGSTGLATGCTADLPAAQTYTESDGCANVYVRGTYSKDLTVASSKDVIVDGDFTQVANAGATAGLIADNFVRVFHPVDRTKDGNGNACDQDADNILPTAAMTNLLPGNPTSVLQNVKIEAAILSLVHSFTVDNHGCGTGFGDLTVKGAIAQKYRGPVGSTARRDDSTTYRTGYTKDYNYDDRLKYRNPPFFLTPVNAAWRIMQTNEDVTPAKR